MTALLLERDFAGFGDWLMALAILKMVARQRPDVRLHVDFRTAREPEQPIVRQAFVASDVPFLEGAPPAPFLRTGHLVYSSRFREKPFVLDMLERLNERTALGIRHEPNICPRFRHPDPETGGYVALIAHGKRRGRDPKDWGAARFAELAQRLQDRVEIVQIGAADDAPLPGAARRYLGQPFGTVARVLAGARLFVGIENGLMVLAGFLGCPQLTIYCGRGNPDRMSFPDQIQIREEASPELVAERVLACC